MALLTDRVLATGVTLSDYIHIVIPTDVSQNPAGSSYKATVGQLLSNVFDVYVTGYTYSNNTFTIKQSDNSFFNTTINVVTGWTVNGNLTVTGNTSLQSTTASTLTLSSTPATDTQTTTQFLTRDSTTGVVKTKTAPGPTVYGLFSQTGDSTVISATTVETSVIDGGVGTLAVPANGFSVGDSFRADFGGLISVKPGGDTIRFRITSNGGTITLADTGVLSVAAISPADVWMLTVNFTVRKLGGAGVASIVTLGNLHVVKTASGTPYSFGFNYVNSTTFNTTILNQLDVTAQWGSNNAANSIYSDIFVLNKIY